MSKMFSSFIITLEKYKQVWVFTNKKIKGIKLYNEFNLS